MQRCSETLSMNTQEIQALINSGLTVRELQLVSALLVLANLPEASTVDNFEAKQLLDKGIRLAQDTLKLQFQCNNNDHPSHALPAGSAVQPGLGAG